MGNFSDLDIRVHRTDALPDRDRALIVELFENTYRRANVAYLELSFDKLRYVTVATAGATPVGFAMGDSVETRLPRLEDPQVVVLGGITCISPRYRRRGLFGCMEGLAASQSGLLPAKTRSLVCGRMAHPAAFRGMSQNHTVVPKPGVAISEWQQEVGQSVAALYGAQLDPLTFVVQGGGIPVGYPNIEVEAPAEEWRVFEPVDRDRGDSLLGIAWSPDAPPGW